jgi:hypothetical protein
MDLLQNFVEFTWYTVVLGFCRHLPLLALCLLMVLLVSGRLGKSFGAPLLIWDERNWRRYFSGFAVTLFFVKVFVIGFVLEGDIRAKVPKNGVESAPGVPAIPPARHPTGRRWVEPALPHYFSSMPGAEKQAVPVSAEAAAQAEDVWWGVESLLHYLIYLFVLLLAVFVVLRLFGPFAVSARSIRWPPTFALGAVTAAALVVGLAFVFGWLLTQSFTEPLKDVFAIAGERLEVPGGGKAQAWVHAGETLFTAALLLAYWLYRYDRRARYVTPVLTLCTVLALAANVYGVASFWIWGSRLLQGYPLNTILVVVLVGVLCLAGWARYKFQFPHIDGADPSNPTKLPGAAPAAAPPATPTAAPPPVTASSAAPTAVQAALPRAPEPYRDEHNRALAEVPAKRPLVVLCVSGGASRAAVWVALVLRELNRHLPGFSHHIRLITGASGGMVGAAYHAACLQKPDGWPRIPSTCCFSAPQKSSLTLDDMVEDLAGDAISPVIHRMLFYDLWSMLWPFPFANDRGRGLETGWHNQLHEALDLPLRAMKTGEEEGWRPVLIFSPMIVEDGRRLLISNEPLDYLTETVWPSLDGTGGQSVSTPAVQFSELFPRATDFRLSTAARMSASFPYISPAAMLPTVPRRRVVDAGYFDNYGIDLAASWLFHHAEVLAKQYSRVVLIQVRDGMDEDARRSPAAPPGESTLPRRGLEGILSPVDGALVARSSVMAYRNDRQLQVLDGLLTLVYGKDFFTTVLFENSASVSMSWYVPPEERRAMDGAVRSREIQERITRLKQWWNAPPPQVPAHPDKEGRS